MSIIVNNKIYLTTKEVAEKCNITVQTVRDWRINKGLKFNKIGLKKFIYSEIELEKFLKGE